MEFYFRIPLFPLEVHSKLWVRDTLVLLLNFLD